YGMDFCCGGKQTVKEACAEKGLDVAQVERELQQADKLQTNLALPYNEWGLGSLADFIVNTHHAYLRKQLPELRKYAAKVEQVHSARHPELHDIQELVKAVDTELTEHMAMEENVLFPWVKQLEAAATGGPAPAQSGSFADTVKAAEGEHDTVGGHLEALRAESRDFAPPADACASYTLLYRMLEELESDLHVHIHLENNILFPKAMELEAAAK